MRPRGYPSSRGLISSLPTPPRGPAPGMTASDHRRCEQCGGAMPNRTHRQRNQKGQLVCDSCSDNLAPQWASYSALDYEQQAEMHRREAEALVSVQRVSSRQHTSAYAIVNRSGNNAVYMAKPHRKVRGYTQPQWSPDPNDAYAFANRETAEGHLKNASEGATIEEHPVKKHTSLQTIAHDSGDMAVLHHCFAGETEYLTRDGVRTLAETVGTTQQVLTSQQGEKSPQWVDAKIVDFGVQSLMKVTLKRNQMTKVVHATAGHRWLEGKTGKYRIVTTENLKPEHRLASLLTPGVGDLKPDHAGIRHGVIFGDGTVAGGRWARVTLWGEKDKELLPYFPGTRQRPMLTPNEVAGVSVTGRFTAEMKTVPSLDNTDEFLYGWLAGYFAADGNVTEQGQAIIDSANIDNLYAVRDVATRLGISVYSISTRWRQGYGDEPREVSRVQFVGSTLNEDFFLIEKHRDRFRFNPIRERVGWTVVSVEETDRVEHVYCAVVPETESFVLADNLWTMNCPFCGSGSITGRSDGSAECDFCNAVFTVQVQPAHPNMPQTIDGNPVTPPGMPGGQETELSGTDDPSVHESEDGVAANPLDDDDPTKPKNPNPFAKGQPGKGGPPQAGDKAGDPTGGAKKKSVPPWLKDKKSFRTSTGATLAAEDYMAHLALTFADDREAVLDTVRVANLQRETAEDPYPNREQLYCPRCGGPLKGDYAEVECSKCGFKASPTTLVGDDMLVIDSKGIPFRRFATKQAVGEVTCPACNGTGMSDDGEEECFLCHGEGTVMWSAVEQYRQQLDDEWDLGRVDVETRLDDLNRRYPRQGARA